eukprot:3467102-Amphidinium_carterae.1
MCGGGGLGGGVGTSVDGDGGVDGWRLVGSGSVEVRSNGVDMISSFSMSPSSTGASDIGSAS